MADHSMTHDMEAVMHRFPVLTSPVVVTLEWETYTAMLARIAGLEARLSTPAPAEGAGEVTVQEVLREFTVGTAPDTTHCAVSMADCILSLKNALAMHVRSLSALLDTNAVADDFANNVDPEWFGLLERVESLRDQMEVEKVVTNDLRAALAKEKA